MMKELAPNNITDGRHLIRMPYRSVGAEKPTGLDAQSILDQAITEPRVASLGKTVVRTDIKSSIGPFLVLPEYKTQYPEVVIQALANLYAEYNRAFGPLVATNREWDTDYQYCMSGLFGPSSEPRGEPINYFVQIDMVGLPERFLETADYLGEEAVREALRGRIFEIENSLAMYQLLEKLFSDGQQNTLFKRQFRASLDDLRQKHDRPIALLAVTEQKYQTMRASEFGKMPGEPLTDREVLEFSGFDRFFGPQDFQWYLSENGGQCDYLLYARTSDPVAKLKKPDMEVEIPLLEDTENRRIIKAHAITFNVDDPARPRGDPALINDTKEYLPLMRMAYPASWEKDLLSPEFAAYLRKSKPYADYPDGGRLSPEFAAYLKSQCVDPARVESGDAKLRAKPMKGTYGCYGHISGVLREKRFRQELRQNMRNRGPYVIQPEMPTTSITNTTDGRSYTYIDRVFFSTNGYNYRFMGGFRSLMPPDTAEAAQGRNHGSKYTVWAEIS